MAVEVLKRLRLPRLGAYFQNHTVQAYVALFIVLYTAWKYQLRIKKMLVSCALGGGGGRCVSSAACRVLTLLGGGGEGASIPASPHSVAPCAQCVYVCACGPACARGSGSPSRIVIESCLFTPPPRGGSIPPLPHRKSSVGIGTPPRMC